MLVLGFQEIVPLTAQQIVQTDPEKRCANPAPLWRCANKNEFRRIWESKILETLDRRPNKKSNYVLLRSEQVSVFLSIQSQLVI